MIKNFTRNNQKQLFTALHRSIGKGYESFYNGGTVALQNNNSPEGKHYNKDWYSDVYDLNNELDQNVELYGRELPQEIDYA